MPRGVAVCAPRGRGGGEKRGGRASNGSVLECALLRALARKRALLRSTNAVVAGAAAGAVECVVAVGWFGRPRPSPGTGISRRKHVPSSRACLGMLAPSSSRLRRRERDPRAAQCGGGVSELPTFRRQSQASHISTNFETDDDRPSTFEDIFGTWLAPGKDAPAPTTVARATLPPRGPRSAASRLTPWTPFARPWRKPAACPSPRASRSTAESTRWCGPRPSRWPSPRSTSPATRAWRARTRTPRTSRCVSTKTARSAHPSRRSNARSPRTRTKPLLCLWSHPRLYYQRRAERFFVGRLARARARRLCLSARRAGRKRRVARRGVGFRERGERDVPRGRRRGGLHLDLAARRHHRARAPRGLRCRL